MVRESQTPRVTQIQVRVDCNGCVQKIKRALNGINGIHDLRVDFSRQRLTIIGCADPEKVVKAIKKTKKNATICSNIELKFSSKPTQPEPKGNAPAPDATTTTQPPLAEAPPAQAGSSSEPPPGATPSPTSTQHNARQQWQNKPGTTPSPAPTHHNASQQWQNNTGTKDVGRVRMIHHHQPNYNYVNRFSSDHSRVDQRDRYHNGQVFLQEPSQSIYVTHSYNTHMPSSYVTEYEHVISPLWHTHYNRMEHYSGDYQNGNVNIASMFSDDNPNACSIV